MTAATADGPSRILVIRLSALGDVIHTIPAVVALKAALPATEFAWVVERPYSELVEIVAGVRAIPVSMKRWGRSLAASRGEIGASVAALRKFGRHETSIDFQGLWKSAIYGAVAGATHRYGFNGAAIREKGALLFVNHPRSVDTSRHVIEQNVALAAAVTRDGVPATTLDFSPFVAEVTPALSALRDRIILLPGAGKANKQWPASSFAAVARHFGKAALAVWGPGEAHLASQIGCDVAPPTTLRELAFVLRYARLVIAGDTGPLHLAAALQAPVIGLFGPTDPRRNGPYGQLERCISRFDSDRDITFIGPDEVIARAESLLGA